LVDVTPPISTFISQTASKVSRVTGKDSDAITIRGSEEWQLYDLRIVASPTDSVTQGTRIFLGPNDQSFETAGSPGGIGWIIGGSGGLPTFAFSTTWASDGLRSLQVNSNGSIAKAANNFRQALSPLIAIAPGQSVSTVADLNVNIANGPMLQMSVVFYNAAGAFISQSVVNIGTTTGIRTQVGVVGAVAPAGAAAFRVAFTMNGAPGTKSGTMNFFIDNFKILWPANQDFTIPLDEGSFELGGAVEGSNLLKVFLQDTAGNWST